MNWLRKSYRSFVDHLTKALGIIGAAIMSAFIGLMGVDPASVHDAAQTYLGQNAAAKIGIALFVLVALRGWYTGWKAKQKEAALAAAQAGIQLPKPTADIPMPPVNAVKILIAFTLAGAALSASIALATEVPSERDIPVVVGHPLTSVVVTQCNLIVAVYMTMPDGRLLRFDKSNEIPSEQLMAMAYSAVRSERVEVSCNSIGPAGYEKHEPV